MADLNEVSQWEPGIYQIEVTDPVLGGAPNLATGQGLSNVQAQQLASRTKFLLDALGGVGGTLSGAVSNLVSHNKSGLFQFADTAVGLPTSENGVLLHFEATTEIAHQVAFLENGATYRRVRSDGAPTWGAWLRDWNDDGFAQSQVNSLIGAGFSSQSLTGTGYQVFPGGLILQWGFGNISDMTGAGNTFNFPLAFPNAALAVLPSDYSISGDLNSAHIVSLRGAPTSTSFQALAFDPSGSYGTTNFQWLAIGF